MNSNIFKYFVLISFLAISLVEAKDECTPEFEITKSNSIAQSTNTDDIEKGNGYKCRDNLINLGKID